MSRPECALLLVALIFEAILPGGVGHPLTKVKIRRQEAESPRAINFEMLLQELHGLTRSPDAAGALRALREAVKSWDHARVLL